MTRQNKKESVEDKPRPITHSIKRSNALQRRGKMPTVVRRVALFLFTAVILLVIFFGWFDNSNRELIHAGVNVGPISAGGKTTTEAAMELRQFISGYHLTYAATREVETIGPFTGAEQNIIQFQIENAVANAYDIGRDKNIILALVQRIGVVLFGATVSVPYSLNEQALLDEVNQKFDPLIMPAEDARLQIAIDDAGKYDIDIISEKIGLTFNADSLITATRERLRDLSSLTVNLQISTDLPKLTSQDLTPLLADAVKILDRAPQSARAKNLTWKITKKQLADWIVPAPKEFGRGWLLTFDQNRLANYLETSTAAIAKEPKDAIFEMDEQGKVSHFEPAMEGEKLDIETSIDLLKKAFLEDTAETTMIELPVTVAYPKIPTVDSNPYGIKEIIGTATTNFKGSPTNRRHNIANGAKALQGLLIPPGEEFSLLTALGEIDAEHGYLEELVIKQNETKPEFGGGLCQIGTTTFRTVLAAGLPVTERRNHSYRVVYYERDGDGNLIGPGKDATIYDPWPDFKFINDTPAHILFLTSVQGDRLQFTFWGANDGRRAEQGEVSIWNIKDPPPKKEILTTNLAVGAKKCTELPHPGASTVFTYTVIYPSNEVKEEKFYSYYRPWQEVCLIGATAEQIAAQEKTEESAIDQTAQESGLTEVPPEG
jgi:vancomycin resistance protein YoaR